MLGGCGSSCDSSSHGVRHRGCLEQAGVLYWWALGPAERPYFFNQFWFTVSFPSTWNRPKVNIQHSSDKAAFPHMKRNPSASVSLYKDKNERNRDKINGQTFLWSSWKAMGTESKERHSQKWALQRWLESPGKLHTHSSCSLEYNQRVGFEWVETSGEQREHPSLDG